jgi:hypothetical protein
MARTRASASARSAATPDRDDAALELEADDMEFPEEIERPATNKT